MLHLKKLISISLVSKKPWITSGIQKPIYIKKAIKEIHQLKGSTNKGCFS